MNRRSLFVLLCLAVGVPGYGADSIATSDLIVFTRAELTQQDQLPQVRKAYREWGMPLMTSQEKVMEAVRADATRDGMSGILITFAGMRREEHSGLTAMFNAVDAYGVKLVDPSDQNVVESLKRFGRVGAIETDFALQRAISQRLVDATPALLAYIKSPGGKPVDPRAVHAYAAILGQEAIPELTKVLRFHANEEARIAAGSELVTLGATAVVQDALANERNDAVRKSLQHALLL